jgi:hypothetical protein
LDMAVPTEIIRENINVGGKLVNKRFCARIVRLVATVIDKCHNT